MKEDAPQRQMLGLSSSPCCHDSRNVADGSENRGFGSLNETSAHLIRICFSANM